MQTYITINENEKRAVRVYLNDNDNEPFQCDSAYASIINSDGVVIREERSCYTDDRSIWDLIETDVTSTIGTYYIKWKIIYGDEIIYHLTMIEVVEI